jgi:hypothetical protein
VWQWQEAQVLLWEIDCIVILLNFRYEEFLKVILFTGRCGDADVDEEC